MEVTYCSSPVLAVREFNMANRILTENLLRNDKLDVKFNYSVLDCYIKYDNQSFSSKDILNHPFKHSPSLWKETLRLHLSSYHYPKRFVETLKTNVVLMSCLSNWYDYPFIVELLNSGFRLVLGGTNFRLWRTPEFITNLLLSMGVKKKYINNFIIVRGLVDLTTDLHKIIEDWKHCSITENDFSTVWDCERDYLYNIINSITNIVGLDKKSDKVSENFNNVTFLTNNGCWWGKCSFCGFLLQPKMNFDEGVLAEKIASNVIKTTKRLNTNRVYFSNDYFLFTEKMKKILEIMKQNGDYKVNCYTGIQMLNKEDYLENINKYNMKYLKVGLESGTDFSLSRFNKGYNVAYVDDTISKMKRILEKDVEVTLHSIIDAPQRSRDEVVKNYDNLLRWRDELRESGIAANIVASSYAIIEEVNSDNCIDNVFIKPCKIEESQSGRVKFLNELKKAFGDVISPRSYNHVIPFNRYDINDKIMPTDFEIIPEETLINLYGKNWGWG